MGLPFSLGNRIANKLRQWDCQYVEAIGLPISSGNGIANKLR